MPNASEKINAAKAIVNLSSEDTVRFWGKVDQKTEDECWEWQGCRFRTGYGQFSAKNKMWLSHRIAFFIHTGSNPVGKLILHSCDNRGCCNPKHLRTGTHKDNADDMMDRGRQARGEGHYSRTRPHLLARGLSNGAHTRPEKRPRGDKHYFRTNPEKVPRGEMQHCSKLTEQKVIEMRRQYAAGENAVKIAARYEIAHSAAWAAIVGKSWKHVK